MQACPGIAGRQRGLSQSSTQSSASKIEGGVLRYSEPEIVYGGFFENARVLRKWNVKMEGVFRKLDGLFEEFLYLRRIIIFAEPPYTIFGCSERRTRHLQSSERHNEKNSRDLIFDLRLDDRSTPPSSIFGPEDRFEDRTSDRGGA